MGKKKIVNITGYLDTGGSETLLINYSTNLDPDRFQSAVICVHESKNTIVEKTLKKSGIPVYFATDYQKIYDVAKKHAPLHHIANFIRCYAGIYKILKQERPDVIHTHLATNRFILPYAITHKKTGLVHTVHCPFSYRFEGSAMARAEYYVVKYLCRVRNMKLIALHDEMAQELNEKFGVKDSFVVDNGIDFQKFTDPGVTKADMREKLDLPQDAFILGHVGRFAPEKNHAFILKVFAELLKRKPDARLLLVGSGRDDDAVRAQIQDMGLSDKITILFDRNDVNEILRAMDAFIFPSTFEGLGIALIEAELSGLRCVVSENVPKETHLSEKLSALSLDAPISDWADAILDPAPHGEIEGDINKYTVQNAVRQLEQVYTKSQEK